MELRERFKLIKAHYELYTPFIEGSRDEWGIDPYAWDEPGTGISLTPIEQALWQDIRAASAIFYPQYPVGRFFVDFGNPAAKIAIECDGKRWHTDRIKDARRQEEIEALGWWVYRISGADCFTETEESFDDDGMPVITISRARKFVDDVANSHFLRRGSFK